MQRRQLLRTLPGVAVAGLAGCIGDGDTAAPTDTRTDTATGTAAPDGVWHAIFFGFCIGDEGPLHRFRAAPML